jgi:hypothetical protein
MKVSKRQLRKIIQEERARLLNEQLTDGSNWQDLLQLKAQALSDQFGTDMMLLFDEDPGSFEGRNTRESWEAAVDNAKLDLDTSLITAMEGAIADVETYLHDGQYDTTDRGM